MTPNPLKCPALQGPKIFPLLPLFSILVYVDTNDFCSHFLNALILFDFNFIVACKVGSDYYPVNELFVTNDCKLMCICQVGSAAACSPLCPKKVSKNCTANEGIFIRYEVRSFKPKCFCERETCVQRHST